ncbi:MAG: transporter substrate-binding domain-containing protein [Herbaspirillum sp.]
MKLAIFPLTALILALMAPLVSQAADSDLGPTLTKIKTAKVIGIGHRTASLPFSYYDENQKVVGFSQDLCQKVIDAVKVRLNMPNLAVRMIPVTSQNRTSLLQNGTIDLECGVTSNLKERWQQISFLTNFFISTPRILTRKDSGIKDFSDLAGKSVVTNAGTSSEHLLRTMNDQKKMNMQVQSVKDYGEGLLLLQSGRAAAYVMDDILLAGTRLQAQAPADWVLVGTAQGAGEPYAFMVRKNDPQFKKLGDDALNQVMKDGEINKMYTRWFQSPIPPKNMDFSFPMSDIVHKLYATPSDTPL